MWVRSLGWEDALEESMATHSSLLAWRIPWTEELVGYSSWGRRVRHDWNRLAHTQVLVQSLSCVRLLSLLGLQHSRLSCLSPTPGACSNSFPLSPWCHPTISSSVIPFSFRHQSFPASGSFPMSPFLASGGQSTGASASASVLPMNIQDWFPLGWTGWISL